MHHSRRSFDQGQIRDVRIGGHLEVDALAPRQQKSVFRVEENVLVDEMVAKPEVSIAEVHEGREGRDIACSTASAMRRRSVSPPGVVTNMMESGRPRSSAPMGTAIEGRPVRLASGV